MTTLADLGIKVESRSAVDAVKRLDSLVTASVSAEKAVTNLGKASTSASTGMQKLVDSSTGVANEFKDAATSAQVFEDSLNDQRASFDALRMSIDPVYASSIRYSEAVEQISMAQRMGIISQSEANASLLAAENRFLSIGDGVDGAGKKFLGSSHNVRMFGQQLSQIAQQGAATGQWATAFSIQAADIGASFGIMGIAIGTVATVALPALIAMFTSGAGSVKSFDDTMKDLQATQSALEESTDILTMSLPELYEKYGLYALSVREATRALVEHQIAQAQIDLAATFLEAAPVIEQYSDAIGRGVMVMADQLGISAGKALELQSAFQKVRDAVSFADRMSAIRELEQALKSAGISSAQLPVELRNALVEANKTVVTMAELANVTEKADAAADSLSSSGPGAGWLSTAISEASALASKLWEAASAKAALGGGSGVRGDPRQFVDDPYWKDKYFPDPEKMNMPSGKSGGGGGGSDEYSGKLQSLIEELRTEREIETEWYEESKQLLDDRRASELIGEEAHKAALIALEEEYQNRLKEIQMQANLQKISDTANLFGALASIASAGGKKTAKIMATFQAIEGTMNAYGAAIKALNTPGITLAGRFAAYASVLAAGLKGVAAIRQAGGAGSGGGSGGGGSMSGVPSQGSSETAGPKQVTKILGIRKDDLFTGEMLYDMLKEEVGIRGLPMVELLDA